MKKRSSVTQKQIAKQAGVSQTVVSFVLSGSYDISLSEDTRQKVMDVANELGYVPQAAAKSLVQGRSTNIGLILVQPHYQVFRDPYIPNVMTGLSGIVQSNGYRLIVEHINDLKDLMTIRNMLMSGEVAGIILSNFHWAKDVVTPLIEDEYPIVSLNMGKKDEKYHSASLDHVNGVRSAISHLINLGHEQIACIAYGPETHLDVIKRLAVVRDTMNQAGLLLDKNFVQYGQYDPDSGYEAMQVLLAQNPRPTAVFGMNDMMAIGALRAILDAGLQVPDDIALVGYDDMRFAKFTNPALTTIHAPEIELGHVAGEMLMSLINDTPVEEPRILLNTELIIRDSCGGNINT